MAETNTVQTSSLQIEGPQESVVLVSSQPFANTESPIVIEKNSKKRCCKLICIPIVACIACVVAIILILTILYATAWVGFTFLDNTGSGSSGSGSSNCCELRFGLRWDFIGTVCGTEMDLSTNNTGSQDVNRTTCYDACVSQYNESELHRIYFITNTSECFCYSKTQFNDSNNYCQSKYNGSVDMAMYEWEKICCELPSFVYIFYLCTSFTCTYAHNSYGRPYNLDSESNIQSGLKKISCSEYSYVADDEWIDFIQANNQSHNEVLYNKWVNKALAEYASIATFSKFSLQLMSIGAPLWFIQLSNEAGLDEIKHSQISLDIANMYVESEHDTDECVTFDVFPEHVIDIDADWNEIATDTAKGGCIGETLSALNMVEDNQNEMHHIIRGYVQTIATDEIRHAALAWITVKWMMDNAPHNMELHVHDDEWWNKQMQMHTSSNEQKHVIHSILQKLKMDIGYEELYKYVIDEIQINVKKTKRCILS